MKHTLLIITFILGAVSSFAQTDYFNLKPDTLIDKKESVKYILDSLHKCVTAFDSAGKQLWITDLVKAEKELFHPQDKEEEFAIAMDFIDVINLGDKLLSFESFHICYGTIDKKSGSIQLSGCD
ncbi:hypothetical protein [Ferruginibacter albus]|uniref:hypothetical protein n=1 Tax=Ferruginibacter albus TaxID=2875540 RepID=UPI001CC47309|nr:hypothetical protein [Ferruginibacter albus]UAY53128.1 hypothetical protein K9M53_05495 [Ferruginibacter albus]